MKPLNHLKTKSQKEGKCILGFYPFFILLIFIFQIPHCAGAGLERGGHSRVIRMAPQATIIRSSEYEVLGVAEGEASTLYLFGFLPVTPPLNPEYALSQAVQKFEGGQSMVDLVIWHETHYYFPLGIVSVWKVEGKVVSFQKGNLKKKNEEKL